MTGRSLSMLIVLNAVLLAALSVSVFSPPPAEAQFGAQSNFKIIAGSVTGRSSQDAVYVIDLKTTRLLGMIFNTANEKVTLVDGVVVANDVKKQAGGGK